MKQNTASHILLTRLSQQGTFTPGERKLADFFEQHYADLAFFNLEKISSNAQVGKSTVTRFVRKLGYASFADFLKSMRSDARSALKAPLSGYAKAKERQTALPATNVYSHIEQVSKNVQGVISANPSEQLEQALAILGDKRMHLYIVGCATTYSLAHSAFLLLRYIRSNVTLLDGDIGTLPHRLAGLEKNAALFAVSFYRFSRVTQNVMQFFHEREHPVLLLTDKFVNPLLPLTTTHLIAPSEGEHTLFSSRAAGMALIEGMVAALAPAHDDEMQGRLEGLESLFSLLGSF